MKPRRPAPGSQPAHRQRGAVTLMTALLLPVLLGVAALAIDLAYVRVVRNELQNAADAAALAGASHLAAAVPTPTQWSQAEQQARQTVVLNRAAGRLLSTSEVAGGFWNPQVTGARLQTLPYTPGPQDVAALQVTVRKAEGVNDGAVPAFMARLWSIRSIPIGASAVAGRVAPGLVLAGGVFPLAVSKCLYDNYWNRLASPPGPRLDPATGQPIVFRIGSAYRYGPCDTGQWTSLQLGTNSAGQVEALISSGNLGALSVGDAIWVQNGTEASLYKTVNACSLNGNKRCAQVVVPVLSSVTPGVSAPIIAFACLELLDAQQGQKYVSARMSRSCLPPGGGGIGPDLGVQLPARLLQ
jgi:Flp pilus assembly protein TadG